MDEQDPPFTKDDISAAERLFGLEFSDENREMLLEGLADFIKRYEAFNAIHLDNSVTPAITFDPRPSPPYFFSPDYPPQTTPVEMDRPSDEELVFLPITALAHLLQSRKITSVELTQIYLDRLKTYNPLLECVITFTDDLAMEQAAQADKELDEGYVRSLLHGIPYGIKDLFAHPKYRTTWGAEPYKDQVIETTATVIKKLDDAGAVMLAKLSLGALAMGDVWFGGKTKSPHNPEQGSSGSSAGSASAVTAGLVGFTIGTETLGSITSPSTACGATGLRPTFGRISRYGALALSWTMDKVGPICRYVEDCAIVFDTIYGADGRDPSVISKPFKWNYETDINKLRVAYDPAAFEAIDDELTKKQSLAALDKIRQLGIELKEISIPDYPLRELTLILFAEVGAAFDEMTRTGKEAQLVRQTPDAWPNIFRQARFIPAVEYIKANRLRRLIMDEMDSILKDIDLYVAPSFSQHLYLTNLTGHPAVVLPNGFRDNGLPTSLTFIGNLFKEAQLLRFAKYYQDNTEFHLKRPSLNAD